MFLQTFLAKNDDFTALKSGMNPEQLVVAEDEKNIYKIGRIRFQPAWRDLSAGSLKAPRIDNSLGLSIKNPEEPLEIDGLIYPFMTPIGTTLATRRPIPTSWEVRTTSSTSL